ncbi:Telomerase ribonucleoprotein complex - RNA-binding domain-containing protein [Rozella allomycis CSF55]|uniref:Telomerase reverse transcriptase n=1 Tax=Rozella allomycis (strain CSF55) TaxID=988480 RepID=A0A075B102_ROZAC|nr:Telomerase ribonucleoprotein complex - RNA-binding domain-containing protein [Rozella allomycis CSF55]|eukprot:EPZ34506.1 Telomerase ribonucleoprotein complex - RNA-binding domain-containing protein [Rozella allomycis CSF55]
MILEAIFNSTEFVIIDFTQVFNLYSNNEFAKEFKIVIRKEEYGNLTHMNIKSSKIPLKDLLVNCILEEINKGTKNLITLGFKKSSSLNFEMLLENTNPNTLISEKDAYIQITGPPVEAKKENQANSDIERSRIYYARPAFLNKNVPLFGFPQTHIFNCSNYDEIDFMLNQVFMCKKLNNMMKKGTEYFKKILIKASKTNTYPLLNEYCPIINNEHTPYEKVVRFLICVYQKIIPSELTGEHNKKVLFKKISTFVSLRRRETIDMHEIMQGIKIKEFKWLFSEKSKYSKTEISCATKLVHNLLKWIFNGFIIPLIRGHFYVTETTSYRHRIFYFRHDVWIALSNPVLENIINDLYQPVRTKQALTTMANRTLGFSFMRLLPKENGMRPIPILCKEIANKHPLNPHGMSINSMLQNLFCVLLKEKKQESLGVSVLGLSDIHDRLKAFAHSCKIDPKYFMVCKSFDKIKRKFFREADDIACKSVFDAFVNKEFNELSNAIIVDQVAHPIEDKESLLNLLENHLKHNLVKIGKDYYEQKCGVPQGSILSTLMCSLFYGSMDREHLSYFIANKNCLVMRYVDDFICVSLDKDIVDKFVQRLEKGFPGYNCFIQEMKTYVNYKSSELKCSVFLGVEVICDYSKFVGFNIADTLTVECGNHFGEKLKTKLKQ